MTGRLYWSAAASTTSRSNIAREMAFGLAAQRGTAKLLPKIKCHLTIIPSRHI